MSALGIVACSFGGAVLLIIFLIWIMIESQPVENLPE
jgi:uncharacterized integral membrane protein